MSEKFFLKQGNEEVPMKEASWGKKRMLRIDDRNGDGGSSDAFIETGSAVVPRYENNDGHLKVVGHDVVIKKKIMKPSSSASKVVDTEAFHKNFQSIFGNPGNG